MSYVGTAVMLLVEPSRDRGQRRRDRGDKATNNGMMVGGKKIGDNAGLIGGELIRQTCVGAPGRNRRDVGCRAGERPNGWKNREGPKNGGKPSFVDFNQNHRFQTENPFVRSSPTRIEGWY